MRALILSDIHGNLDALEAVLADAAPSHYDQLWDLGDVVGYGARPNEVVALMRQHGTLHVRGNHDRVCSGLTSSDGFNPIAAAAAAWTHDQLTPENLEWVKQMAHGPVLPAGTTAACVHGSPLDEDEYIVSLRDACEPLRVSESYVTFFGHTHLQGGFSCDGQNWVEIVPRYLHKDDPERWSLDVTLDGSARYLINPGSVGQPRDYDWRAAYAIYDDAAALITFHRIPYNVQQSQDRIRRAGLPERLATRLREGR